MNCVELKLNITRLEIEAEQLRRHRLSLEAYEARVHETIARMQGALDTNNPHLIKGGNDMLDPPMIWVNWKKWRKFSGLVGKLRYRNKRS